MNPTEAPLRYPTFVVIGAMRSGTTSFHAFLDRHPEVFMSPVKGPALFVDPTEPIRYPSKYVSLAEKRGNLSDEELIADLTRTYSGEPHFGEATDLYTRFPAITSNVPSKMLHLNPGMKLVYLLRHPVDRLLSQFRFEQTKPLNKPPNDLAQYLRFTRDAINTSQYYRQLSRFLDAGFGRERIQLIVLEELLRDPRGEWKKVCRFLEVAFVEPGPFPRLNSTPSQGLVRSLDETGKLPQELVRALRRDVERLEDFMGLSIDVWRFE
ncbi:MAG: sulfotransferase [Gemmatimonadales bacterium]|jgi:hypothetical protein